MKFRFLLKVPEKKNYLEMLEFTGEFYLDFYFVIFR